MQTTDTTEQLVSTRRISFRAEAVFQSAVQESDNRELWKLLESAEGQNLNVNDSNHVGLTALHQTVLNNNIDGMKMLLSRGADVNKADVNGFTPIHTAAACDLLQVTSFLILFGANVFSVTNDGDLPVDLTKDSQVANMLTSEMIQEIHSKTYWKCMLLHHLCELLKWLLVFILQVIVTVFENVHVIFTHFGKQQAEKSLQPPRRKIAVHGAPDELKLMKLD